MATSLPEGGNDTEGTDFLATQRVFGAGRPGVGLDVLATKVAVDFQGLTSEGGDSCIKRNLEALREAAGLDAICIVLFDSEHTIIEHVAARPPVRDVQPAGAEGRVARAHPVPAQPPRAPARRRDPRHAQPRRELAVDAARFAELNCARLLMCGLSLRDRVHGFIALCSTQPRDSWDANLHLMLKLLGSSYATGIERLRVERHLSRARGAQRARAARRNDGLWDFDLEQQHVFLAALEDDARLRRRRPGDLARLAAARPSRRPGARAGA